jgi:thymidylate synthase (FAD)
MERETQEWFRKAQITNSENSFRLYNEALERGIAKEQARFLLPLNTITTIYMTGCIRSWIHYIELRSGIETQQEHRDIAILCREIFEFELPIVSKALQWSK